MHEHNKINGYKNGTAWILLVLGVYIAYAFVFTSPHLMKIPVTDLERYRGQVVKNSSFDKEEEMCPGGVKHDKELLEERFRQHQHYLNKVLFLNYSI